MTGREILGLFILAAFAALTVFFFIRRKKGPKGCHSCSGACAGCTMACHHRSEN